MGKVLRRINDSPQLEVRGDGRTIVGIAVPFDEPTTIYNGRSGKYTEIIRRGAFEKTIRERGRRVRLQVNHDDVGRLPIGVAKTLREDPVGLYAEFRVSETRAGDEVLMLVRDGALDGLSIGFRDIRHRERDGVVERLELALDEVSVVANPAFAGARITGLRSLDPPHISVDEAAARFAAFTRISTVEAVERLRNLQRTI